MKRNNKLKYINMSTSWVRRRVGFGVKFDVRFDFELDLKFDLKFDFVFDINFYLKFDLMFGFTLVGLVLTRIPKSPRNTNVLST